MTESVKGRTVAEAERLFATHARAADAGRLGRGRRRASASSRALSGVREFPARVKCASLCWHTLDAALHRADRASTHRVTTDRERSVYRHDNEPVIFNRDVDAVIVPAGLDGEAAAGPAGFITQALGGSFTVYVEGNLFRIAGKDADAIGKEAVDVPQLPPNATDDDVRELAWQQMRTCYDPEIPINIVDLGLVYSCDVTPKPMAGVIAVKMTLTAPGCGMGEVLVQDVREKVEIIPTVKRVDVELVFDPPWNQSMMSEAARLQTGMM